MHKMFKIIPLRDAGGFKMCVCLCVCLSVCLSVCDHYEVKILLTWPMDIHQAGGRGGPGGKPSVPHLVLTRANCLNR